MTFKYPAWNYHVTLKVQNMEFSDLHVGGGWGTGNQFWSCIIELFSAYSLIERDLDARLIYSSNYALHNEVLCSYKRNTIARNCFCRLLIHKCIDINSYAGLFYCVGVVRPVHSLGCLALSILPDYENSVKPIRLQNCTGNSHKIVSCDHSTSWYWYLLWSHSQCFYCKGVLFFFISEPDHNHYITL